MKGLTFGVSLFKVLQYFGRGFLVVMRLVLHWSLAGLTSVGGPVKSRVIL